MKRNTFVLKCFLQFARTNLDGSQKKGVTFKICFRKRGVPRREGGGSLRNEGVPTVEETVPLFQTIPDFGNSKSAKLGIFQFYK